MTATEHVILVDENDNTIGTAEKLSAHQNGQRHRAFSVFVLRKEPDLSVLLQKRSATKYHSPSLWTNTCCSHPRPGEDIIKAAERRLKEEMNIQIPLHPIGKFHYIAHFDNGLTENEIDHVLVGHFNQELIHPNPKEVADYRWVSFVDLKRELLTNSLQFTPWLDKALRVVENNLTF